MRIGDLAEGGGCHASEREIALDRHVDGGVFHPVDGGGGMRDANVHSSISMRGMRGTVPSAPPPCKWRFGRGGVTSSSCGVPWCVTYGVHRRGCHAASCRDDKEGRGLP